MTSEATSATLPAGLRVRETGDADIDRVVTFRNRYATPSQWQSPAAVRQMEAASPEPNRLRLLVEDGSGAVVAFGMTGDGGLFRSPDGSWRVNVLVDQQWRRMGVGAALLARVEPHAKAKGAKRLIAAVRGNEPESAAFARSHGYAQFHERIDAYIDVPAFDAAPFGDPDEKMRTVGIRLASYGALMKEHAADTEAFQRRMLPAIWAMARDVPSPAPMPETPPPFEQAKRMFFEGPGIDADTTILALRGDDIVGMSVTAVKENDSAYTNFTGVARAERGKGIALAMKLRALAALKKRGIRLFGTTNDEQNAAMRGINRKLGYVPDAPTLMFEKKFS
ncbi:MAG TPA: GNAT family N-acetyltransferase [Candidatus Acidoferrales bacterium]|nr:GNAT family N-acetyltransferase [Candidatus Acidoferrales bacterium]